MRRPRSLRWRLALSIAAVLVLAAAATFEAIYRGKANIPVDTVIRFQDGTTQRVRTTLQVVDLGRAAIAEAAE